MDAFHCQKCRRVLFVSTALEPPTHPDKQGDAKSKECTSLWITTPPAWMHELITKPVETARVARRRKPKTGRADGAQPGAEKGRRRGQTGADEDDDDFGDDDFGDEDDDLEEGDDDEDDGGEEDAGGGHAHAQEEEEDDAGPPIGANAGKLACPSCGTRFGAFCWSGTTCSCGTWVVPGIQVHASKVDRRKVPKDLLPLKPPPKSSGGAP